MSPTLVRLMVQFHFFQGNSHFLSKIGIGFTANIDKLEKEAWEKTLKNSKCTAQSIGLSNL